MNPWNLGGETNTPLAIIDADGSKSLSPGIRAPPSEGLRLLRVQIGTEWGMPGVG
jgi:hypothetical protein